MAKKWTEWQLARGEHRFAYRAASLVGGLLQKPLEWLGEQREFIRRGYQSGKTEAGIRRWNPNSALLRRPDPAIDAARAKARERSKSERPPRGEEN